MNQIPVVINATNGAKKDGEIVSFSLPLSIRLQRAGKRLGTLWLVAALCVFIPMVHFVLVPLFLIAGLVVALITFSQRDRVSAEEIVCPDCSKQFPIPEMKAVWPINSVCPHCGRNLWIERQ